MLDLSRALFAFGVAMTLLAVTYTLASPIEFEVAGGQGSFGDGQGIQKRYSEFLGGPGKRSIDTADEMLQKRYSEFLGGPGKRYSEFLGGPGKRNRQENLRNMAKAREALRMILSGRALDLDDRR
ncbi:uncharacterized protein LOC111270453 isoform X2 [Varroa jacobsoni]|uniref:Uncharacterized protein n=2 Tax=Varroa TaxID=62624 RepID=A0A7M7JC39_VARDE|nr:uncharacterized protein LOC111245583 [Varroa destructor]XP_022706425.1 uncharacterized protein LOC111270453 isoform X2 [Varroa jacobsoni]